MLYVDRAEVDSAPGVWVDAGDAVTCTFTPLLTTVGTHQVEVKVADVAPGDYDPSNNAAAGVVEVLPGASLNYAAQLRDGSYRSPEKYEVNLSASAVGGPTIYRAIPFAVPESYSYAGRVQPLTCSETPGGTGTFRYCYEFSEYNEGKLGFAEQIVSP